MYTSLEQAKYEMQQAAYSAISLLTCMVAMRGGEINWEPTSSCTLEEYNYRIVGLRVINGSLYLIDENKREILLKDEYNLQELYTIIDFLTNISFI